MSASAGLAFAAGLLAGSLPVQGCDLCLGVHPLEELPDGVYRSVPHSVLETLDTDELTVRVEGKRMTIAYSTHADQPIEVVYRLDEER